MISEDDWVPAFDFRSEVSAGFTEGQNRGSEVVLRIKGFIW